MKEYFRNLWDEFGMLIPLYTLVFIILVAIFGLAYLAVMAPDTYTVTLLDGSTVECISQYECNWGGK